MHIKHVYGRRLRDASTASLVLSSRLSDLKSSIELGELELKRRLTGQEAAGIEKQPASSASKTHRRPLEDLTSKQIRYNKNNNTMDLGKPSRETELPSILSSPLITDNGKAVFRRKRINKWKTKPAQKPKRKAEPLPLLSDPDYLDGKIWVKE